MRLADIVIAPNMKYILAMKPNIDAEITSKDLIFILVI
jgi:hypothetical protein